MCCHINQIERVQSIQLIYINTCINIFENEDIFTFEIIASNGRMEVILNETESVVYEDIHMEKWGVFENYFKAGNYLQTLDIGASAKVKYYELEVTH